MTVLEIFSTAELGPVSVEVFGAEGERSSVLLSAGKPRQIVDVPPGRYGVVARTLNGEKQRYTIDVQEGTRNQLSLRDPGEHTPNEFMRPEVTRGFVKESIFERGDLLMPHATLAGNLGIDGATIDAARSLGGAAHDFPSIASESRIDFVKQSLGGRAAEREFYIVAWEYVDQTWKSCDLHQGPLVSGSFAKIAVDSRAKASAVGVLNEKGFGPVVIVPSFRQQTEITIIAKALKQMASDRTANPSGMRAPVVLATPQNPEVADILQAVGAPFVDGAEILWAQSARMLDGDERPGGATDLVRHKFDRPTEALLGAHYLLRFCPHLLPPDWANNLIDAAPEMADGPVVAAWLLILGFGQESDDKSIDRRLDELLKIAVSRHVTLFARTRFLLNEALRLQKTPLRDGLIVRRFLQFGANAGGLECFWGTDPGNPGPTQYFRHTDTSRSYKLTLAGETFVRAKPNEPPPVQQLVPL